MFAICVYNGIQKTIMSLLSKDKLIFTIPYLITLFASIYYALDKNYILTLITSVLQCVCLVYYGCSSFPGGLYMINIIKTTIMKLFSMCCKLIK